MKIDRVFSTLVEEPIARSRISGYLASIGYEKKAGLTDLVFARGTTAGSWLSFSPKKFKTVLTIRTQLSPDGSTQVNLVYDINTTGQIITKREVKFFENEISETIKVVEGFNAGMSVNRQAEFQVTLQKRRREGSNLFFWIAGLSLVNSAVALFGGSMNFTAGLGMTQFVDGFALLVIEDLGTDYNLLIKGVAIALDLIIAGMFVLMGIFSKKHKWVFIPGMIIYGLDTLIFLLIRDFIGFGFHLLFLGGMIGGYMAFRQIEQKQAQPVLLP